MYFALVILILLVCLLLSLIVLAQNPKGGGVGSQFGGGAVNLMGVKRTGDLLEKLTWGFAIGLIVLTLATHMLGGGSAAPVRSVNQQAAQRAVVPTAPTAPAPGVGAPGPAPTPRPIK
ncbi:preprotein translocase subunit SecG [Hymenobacter psoromatis]|uniref:preprotein translocase subunit SecG n=1 Tax=Hymenobacter psoromatis TaxID=1484116 RepID=UPI001CBCC3D6|nr:preprotein translocase subunit SecG [Hymenobacter psoromatis]